METYEPLTPPEYKRNKLGQFDRPGKALAKTAKKTGLNIKSSNSSSGHGALVLAQEGHPEASML